LESLFSFLFKYRPILFVEGEVVFRASWPVGLLLLLALGAGGLAVLSYRRPRGKATGAQRALLTSLRLGAFALLGFSLFRPTLVNTSTVPQQNFVGVLLDDSRSMGLPGADGRPRSSFVEEEFNPEEGRLIQELEERFSVRYFRYSSAVDQMEGMGELTFAGTRTNLVQALDRVREELSSVPLSGLVVVSDGADNSGLALGEAMVPLQAASVPVYTVGLGPESISPDIQVGRISAPRTVLEGTSLLLDLVVSQRGFAGRTLPLVVEDQDRILTETQLRFGEDGEPTVAQVRFTLDQPGPRHVRLRVPVQDEERVTRNNERSVEIAVRETREKILYFEGEPRFEVGFLKRALADDRNIQVVVLQRTAEDKFLRLNVDDGDELSGGFPRTREELFKYRGLILGSVEASYFTHDQLGMIADFVSRRGGGLLALGGRWAFAEGGYAGTPVEEALPVILEEPAPDVHAAFARVSVRPTQAGLGHVAAQIRPDGGGSQEVWDSLPPLSVMNHIRGVKPGATTLLAGDTGEDERVVLAYQRYGRGKAVALPVVDSWMWQFHAQIPVDDPTHETFWQQLLRWLVDGVPEYVEARTERETVEPGEQVGIVSEVHDSAFVEVNDALVEATVTGPDGTVQVVPMDWSVDRDGEYAGTFRPTVEGGYDIQVRVAQGAEESVGLAHAHVQVGPSAEEYFDAGQRRSLLTRLARETGGRYYDPTTVQSLPEDIQWTGAGVTLTEERDLWDMPILFFLLVALVGIEWALRRQKGLA